jgi:septum site-determining protein MinC
MTPDPTDAPERSPAVQLDPSTRPPVILLEGDADWAHIREDAHALLAAAGESWAGAEVLLDLGGKEPDLFDLRRLVRGIEEQFELRIIGMRCLDRSLLAFAERELKVRIQLHDGAEPAEEDPPSETAEEAPAPPPAAAAEPSVPAEPTEESPEPTEEPVGITGAPVRIVRRTLRGGTVLRHSGDLVLYGDVNPGAEIIAGGSITILGTMLGMAHAGTRAGDRAWTMALELRPTQLRIGQRITIPEASGGRPRAGRGPEIAFVREGQVVIEPYRGRLPPTEHRRSDA